MLRHAPLRLFLAGFFATFLITMMLHPIFGDRLPNVELGTMIGSLFAGSSVEPYTGWWWFGLSEHFFNGCILFPLIFSALVSRFLPANSILAGTLWGLTLWAVSQTIVLPLLGYGFFASKVSDPTLTASVTLILHTIYGVMFGAVVGSETGTRKTRVPLVPTESLRKSAA